MTQPVDSFRFIDRPTRTMIEAWIKREPAREIPWTALDRPLSQCKVALLSTAGIALKDDQPFDQQGERDDPWWGDPTHRVIPRGTTTEQVGLHHLHIDTSHAEQDLNCVLPLQRLEELQQAGEVGGVAESHYSIMGYLLRTAELVQQTMPRVVARLKEQQVDVVLLVPV